MAAVIGLDAPGTPGARWHFEQAAQWLERDATFSLSRTTQ